MEAAPPASAVSPIASPSGPWALIAAIVVSRAVALALAWVAERSVMVNPKLTSGEGGPILRSLTAWDGWWYLGIARDGYHAAPLTDGYHDYAFLPLWPALAASSPGRGRAWPDRSRWSWPTPCSWSAS